MGFNSSRSFLVAVALVASVVLGGCDTSTWDGAFGDAGGDYSKLAAVSGTPGTSAHFGSWVNNAWGPSSQVLDPSTFSAKKCHPPLYGATICVEGRSDIPCAVTDASGRFDLFGLPRAVVHLGIHMDGYYDLVIPFDGFQGDMDAQPALEIASNELQSQLYGQLSLPSVTHDPSRGGMSIMMVQGLGTTGDVLTAGTGTDACGQPDHHEQNSLVKGVWARYRRVYNPGPSETYGPWKGNDALLGNDGTNDMTRDVPGTWNTSRGEIVYLDAGETPSTPLFKTSASGLALAVELAPGTYEVEVDEDHRDLLGAHWDCLPIHTMPIGSSGHRARTIVRASGLSDVRIACQPE